MNGDAETLADALAAHIWHNGLGKCECGWEPTCKDSYAEGEEDDEPVQWAEHVATVLAAHDAAIRAEAKIQGVEEAAANMPLARTAQPYEGAAKWLRARAAAIRATQPTEGTCPDCGHQHTPDGCTGAPTDSDRWAGVGPAACDCADRTEGES